MQQLASGRIISTHQLMIASNSLASPHVVLLRERRKTKSSRWRGQQEAQQSTMFWSKSPCELLAPNATQENNRPRGQMFITNGAMMHKVKGEASSTVFPVCSFLSSHRRASEEIHSRDELLPPFLARRGRSDRQINANVVFFCLSHLPRLISA